MIEISPVISTMPDGMPVVEARGMLQDLEIQALKKDRGIWAKTNWDHLPAERQLQRKELAEAQIAKDQNAPGPDFKINPNLARHSAATTGHDPGQGAPDDHSFGDE